MSAKSRPNPAGGQSAASSVFAKPSPPTGYPVTVSHVQIDPLMEACYQRQLTIAAGGEAFAATTSADLGLSTLPITISAEGMRYATGELLTWEAARHIIATPNQCFTIVDGVTQPIAQFSPTSNSLRSLMPTAGAPTMLVSGFSMHRIKGTEPWADTQAKARAVAPISGRTLDTTTGLGYTAILAARSAAEVVTIELDPTGPRDCASEPLVA